MDNYNNSNILSKYFKWYTKQNTCEEFKKRLLDYLINEESDNFKQNTAIYDRKNRNTYEADFEVLGYSGVVHALILNFISSNIIEYNKIKEEIINLIKNNNIIDIDSILIFELRFYNKIDQERLIDDLINCYIESRVNNFELSEDDELYTKLLDHYGNSFEISEIAEKLENEGYSL